MDNVYVLKDREELIRESGRFPLDFAAESSFGVADRLSISESGKEVTPAPLGEMVEKLSTLDSVAPQIRQVFDEQIERWLLDLQKSPKNAFLLNNAGNAYLATGDVNEAMRYFEMALEIDSSLISARASLAKVYMMQERIEEALEIYLDECKRRPKDTKTLMNLAHVYLRQNELKKARDAYDQALSLEPENPAAHHNKGVLYVLEGKPDRAVSEFRRAVSLNARFARAHNALGVCYALLGNYRKAIRYLQMSVAIDGSAISTTKNLATVYQQADDFAASAKLMDTYLSSYPRDCEARNIAAYSYIKMKDYERTLSHLQYLRVNSQELALDKDRFAAVLNNIGVVYQHMGRFPKAVEMYGNSIAIREQPNPITFFNLAKLYVDLGGKKQAERLIDEYLAVQPNDPAALVLLAQHYYNQNEFDDAVDILLRVLELDPQSRDACVLLGSIYSEAFEEHDRAIGIFRQCLASHPHDQAVINNLAYSYAMMGQTIEANAVMERVKWQAADFFAYATKGLIRISEGKLDEGKRLYDYAASHAWGHEWKERVRQKKRVEIARYLIAQGKKREALSHLNKAISTKTTSKLFVRQAERLLAQIELPKHG